MQTDKKLMKNDLFSNQNGECYLFQKSQANERYDLSELKNFILFLKFIGHGQIQFSHSPADPILIKNLTLKDALELECPQFSESVHVCNMLMSLLPPEIWNEQIANISASHLKIIALMQSIFSKNSILFWEAPEKYLEIKELKLVKEAIQHEIIQKKRHLFITSLNPILWEDLAEKLVVRNENFDFQIIAKTILAKEQSISSLLFHFPDNWKKAS